MRKLIRVYIAGPYRADNSDMVDINIARARSAMVRLMEAGYAPFCPHTMTGKMERDYPEIAEDVYLDIDIDWMLAADALLAIDGWQDSEGTKAEIEIAEDNDIPVFYSIEALNDWRKGSHADNAI